MDHAVGNAMPEQGDHRQYCTGLYYNVEEIRLRFDPPSKELLSQQQVTGR